MKGLIWKYDADTEDNFLRDKGLCSDPDFWSNSYPVWGICAPYVRKSLRMDDVVFFIPQKTKDFSGYICTGVLVMKKSIPSFEEVLRSDEIENDYKDRYRHDMAIHLEDDKQKGKLGTRVIRNKNFIVGDSERSYWFGREGVKIEPVVKELKLARIVRALGKGRNQSIPHLNASEAMRLYRKVVSIGKPVSRSSLSSVVLVSMSGGKCAHIH